MIATAIDSGTFASRVVTDPVWPERDHVITVDGLTKSYSVRRALIDVLRNPFSRPRAPVLRDVTFDVQRGELFGVLGLNGAGKTTLLKMLATLLLPDAGSATIGGYDVEMQSAAVRAQLAMVTADERSLNWRLGARENLRLFAGLHRMSAAERRPRVEEVLALVGLDETGDKLVGAFSSGMRQRLLVARALLPRPRVLLLDEPTRSLDPVSAHDFRRLLRETLIDRLGATVLLATHNAEEAFSYCDRVLVLHRGSVAAQGTARELVAVFGDDRYQVSTPTPEHHAFLELARAGKARIVATGADAIDDGVTLAIAGDENSAADVLRRLVLAGVSISRFEPVPVALSTLIARIVSAHDELWREIPDA